METVKDKVVLIGMPGCGKTTIGKVISNELNYNFYDMDSYIESMVNKTVKEIFDNGEEEFRELETQACKELVCKKRAVISSGGGVVKRKNNIDVLKEDSIIVFIDRPTEKIIGDVDTDSRPLLKEGKDRLYKLYEERYNLYKEAADITIKNEGFLRDLVDELLKLLKSKVKE